MSRNSGGTWALVSGGSQGIGRATVDRLASEGIGGVVLDILEPSALPVNWSFYRVDFSSVDEILSTVAHLRTEDLNAGPPRLVVCAAGVNGSSPTAFDVDEFDWDRIIDINVKGVFFLAREAMAWMRDSGLGGRIISIASTLATASIRANPHYSISKAAVVQMTRVLALEGAVHGVQVNAISPGVVETAMTVPFRSDEAWTKERIPKIPAGRFALPEEIAEVICKIGLIETTYLTGQEIRVDGGFLLP